MSATLTDRCEQFTEYAAAGVAKRIDEDYGVLMRVRVLGLESKNGRRYSAEAVRRAIPLYEGIGVFVDHHSKPAAVRSYRDRIGTLQSVGFQEGQGLFGNLHLNMAHPLYAQIMADAKSSTPGVGLSHVVEGRSVHLNGLTVVEDIERVVSVDLVCNPATANSLFESANRSEQPPVRRFSENMSHEQFVAYITGEPTRAEVQAFARRIRGDDERPSKAEVRAFVEQVTIATDDFLAPCRVITERVHSRQSEQRSGMTVANIHDSKSFARYVTE